MLVPEGARGSGRFLLTWRTAEEEQEIASGKFSLTILRHLVDRMIVSDAEVDLASTRELPYSLPDAPKDAVPMAIVDVEHTFWETFRGGGKGFMAHGSSGGGTLRLAQAPAQSGPPRER